MQGELCGSWLLGLRIELERAVLHFAGPLCIGAYEEGQVLAPALLLFASCSIFIRKEEAFANEPEMGRLVWEITKGDDLGGYDVAVAVVAGDFVAVA